MNAALPKPARFAALLAAAVLLAMGRGAAAGDWVDHRQVGPFAVVSQFPLAELEGTLAELVDLERELRRVLALRPCAEPLGVVLLADEHAYRRVLAERFPGVPFRRALFVRQGGESTVYAFRHPELAIDLRHECTHALVHADLPGLPLWLDEGLAEYFELPAAERAFNNPHEKALSLPMWLGMVRSLESLEKESDLAGMTVEDYRDAWAWTHFLLHGPEDASRQLWGYIGTARAGHDPGLMSTRLQSVFKDPSGRLVRHFRGWSRLAGRQTVSR